MSKLFDHSKRWFFLAIASLLASGFLSLAVTGAKMPWVKEFVDIQFIRWCLVVHINLATLIWFTAVPVAMLYLATPITDRFLVFSRVGFYISVLGILMMITVFPGKGEPILSSYIPVLKNPQYYLGLTAYSLGVLINLIVPRLPQVEELNTLRGTWPGWAECRFGMNVGCAFIFFAVLLTAKAFWDIRGLELVTEKGFFETGMWGGGHFIQHSSAVFMLISWAIILSVKSGKAIFTRTEMFKYFAYLSLPILAVPILIFYKPTEGPYRQGFTLLMQLGIAPAVLLFIVNLLRKLKMKACDFKDYRVVAAAWSVFLILLGFIFGALIVGSDMRVPGHYHASIGAVTLAFMALSLYGILKFESKWSLYSAWFYGVGQSLFSTGMFVAGIYGMSRKTYGSEHSLDHWGQSLGLGIMAFGGTIALLGGVFYALAVMPSLIQKYRKAV